MILIKFVQNPRHSSLTPVVPLARPRLLPPPVLPVTDPLLQPGVEQRVDVAAGHVGAAGGLTAAQPHQQDAQVGE